MVPSIEFVCTANQGRSPVAELVAHDYLLRTGLDDRLQAVSSGSHVETIKAGTSPLHVKLFFIEQALLRGDIYSSVEDRLIRSMNTSNESENIDRLCAVAVDRFHREEIVYRAEALAYFGIPGSPKSEGEQTVAHPDRIVVLPMAKNNLQRIDALYEAAGFWPQQGIICLGEYATGDSRVFVPDAFGKGRDEYFATVEAIKEQVPKAVDRALRCLR